MRSFFIFFFIAAVSVSNGYSAWNLPYACSADSISYDWPPSAPLIPTGDGTQEYFDSHTSLILSDAQAQWPTYTIVALRYRYEYYNRIKVWVFRVNPTTENQDTICICQNDTSRSGYHVTPEDICIPCLAATVQCWELGNVNQDKVNMPDGKWVHVKMVFPLGSAAHCHDTDFTTMVTNGCAGIDNNGQPLVKYNPFDTTVIVDGVNMPYCHYQETMRAGTCEQNGLDTGCGGYNPYSYGSRNDSIENPCRFDETQLDSTDYGQQRPDSNLATDDTNPSTNGNINAGINKLSDDLREEHALDREAMGTINTEQKKQTGILGQIRDAVLGVGKTVLDIAGKIGSGGTDSVSAGTFDGIDSGDGYADTAGIGNNDTSGMAALHGKIASDTILDTSLTDYDSSDVSGLFSKFNVDIFSGDCECNDDWAVIDVPPFADNMQIDLCSHDVATITKPLCMFIAVCFVFLFYFFAFWDMITKVFS